MITQNDIYLDPEFYVELKNVDNRYYSSLFHFGSNAQRINLIYDSQTDWTIVFAKECPNSYCNANTERYDRSTSTSSALSTLNENEISFGDTGGLLQGRSTNDIVCLIAGDFTKTCTQSSFTFFEVTKTRNISLNSNYSGVVGLAPDDASNGPSFVAKL